MTNTKTRTRKPRAMVKTFEQRKAEAREEALNWLFDFENHNYTYEEVAAWQDYFRAQGRTYGLTAEFSENGII